MIDMVTVVKTVSAMDARRKFGELMNRVSIGGDTFIIERAGKPLVKISPIKRPTRLSSEKPFQKDPFENPFSTFDEWSDPSNDVYDEL